MGLRPAYSETLFKKQRRKKVPRHSLPFECGLHLVTSIHFSFGSIGVRSQGFVLVRQALYHLSRTPGTFCFSYITDRVSSSFPGLASNLCSRTHASHVVGIKAPAPLPGLFVQMMSHFLPEVTLDRFSKL
jgi:hypothetical protein